MVGKALGEQDGASNPKLRRRKFLGGRGQPARYRELQVEEEVHAGSESQRPRPVQEMPSGLVPAAIQKNIQNEAEAAPKSHSMKGLSFNARTDGRY